MGALFKDVKASGNINSEEVLAVIKKHLDEIKACLPKALQQRTLTLFVHFHPDGKIKEVRLESKEQAGYEKCLAGRLKKWAWPPTWDGRPGEITLEIKLVS